MDRFIKSLPATADDDLMLCDGVAYQSDMSRSVPYDAAYFDKYVSYEGAEIARKLNAGRVEFVNKHVGRNAVVLDVGIGSGEFIKSRPHTFGRDVNKKAEAWLNQRNLWGEFADFGAFTFWDVMEHVREPEDYFRCMSCGSYVFVSIPIFDDLTRVRESKHYRPDEHYYYFTETGFVDWMSRHGFVCRDKSEFETRAGRESIMSFAFYKQ